MAARRRSHAGTVPIYHLTSNVTIVPFVDDFFGSPASGSYTYSIFLPDVRIGAAELFVTNVRGNSPVASASFGATSDQGLRTLAGGQLSIQVEGYLAIQTDAAPPLVIEIGARGARYFRGGERGAQRRTPIQLTLRQGSTVYCTLTIADGATMSTSVDGFGLPPLASGR